MNKIEELKKEIEKRFRTSYRNHNLNKEYYLTTIEFFAFYCKGLNIFSSIYKLFLKPLCLRLARVRGNMVKKSNLKIQS